MAQDGAAGLAHDMEVRRNGKAKDEDIGYDTGKPVEKYISVQHASGAGTASGGYVQFKRCGGCRAVCGLQSTGGSRIDDHTCNIIYRLSDRNGKRCQCTGGTRTWSKG